MKKTLKRFALVLVAIVIFFTTFIGTYCAAYTWRYVRRDTTHYNKMKEACYSAPEGLAPKEFCDYIPNTYFPDMTGKCEGLSKQDLATFQNECDVLRKNHPDLVAEWVKRAAAPD